MPRAKKAKRDPNLEIMKQVSMGLFSGRDTYSLVELMLKKSREVTAADAGSLYLVEEDPSGGGRHLVFWLTQCDSRSFPFTWFSLPINTSSLAGYSAATGQILNIKDAYRIRNLPFRHNRDFDRISGYRTKSMLVIPMKNHREEVIGVLQLINAKRHREVKLNSPEACEREVVPFTKRSQDVAYWLAAQAALALENSLLYRETRQMFDGFVKALTTLVESLDPAAYGHSLRVAKMTVALAEAVDRATSGPYKQLRFTPEHIQEIRYAALLHNIGNVGVGEETRAKARKLEPSQLDLVKKRFDYARKAIELESSQMKLDYLARSGNEGFQDFSAGVDAEQLRKIQALADHLHTVMRANEPAVLPEKTVVKLAEIAGWTFPEPSGQSEPLLTADELKLLSAAKGGLEESERLHIESHVAGSVRVLEQIRWPKELKNIPKIVAAHHEKLDGSGYPHHKKSDEIPFQAKIMTICEIFDALTAYDRPGKKAVPAERALEIMKAEVAANRLDPELFRLFVEAKAYQPEEND